MTADHDSPAAGETTGLITRDELRSLFGDHLPMEAVAILMAPDLRGDVEGTRAKLRVLAALRPGEDAGERVDQVAMWRDCFAEITAKATPYGSDDPIKAYIIPAGPLHRAAGKTDFQMFDGERFMTELTAHVRDMNERVIPQIMGDARQQLLDANALRFPRLAAAPSPRPGEDAHRVAAIRCHVEKLRRDGRGTMQMALSDAEFLLDAAAPRPGEDAGELVDLVTRLREWRGDTGMDLTELLEEAANALAAVPPSATLPEADGELIEKVRAKAAATWRADEQALWSRCADRILALTAAQADADDMVCPFCNEGAFDSIGLKLHLSRGWCEVFEAIEARTSFERDLAARQEAAAPPHPRDAEGAGS
jgi:hypothetical protein